MEFHKWEYKRAHTDAQHDQNLFFLQCFGLFNTLIHHMRLTNAYIIPLL